MMKIKENENKIINEKSILNQLELLRKKYQLLGILCLVMKESVSN